MISVVKCQNFFGIKYLYRIFSEIRLIGPKAAQFFVRRKLQFFTMGGTVAPRLSIRIFQTGSYRPAIDTARLKLTRPIYRLVAISSG